MRERLNYVDALRGLTMVSVVMVHVLVRSFGLNPLTSGLGVIRGSFTLPLFFFVSGFFAYRPIDRFDRLSVRRAVTVRMWSLLCGSMVFDTLFLVTSGAKDPFVWTSGNFDSYWFTIVLFQIYIIYLLCVGAARLLHDARVSTALLVTAGVAGFIAHYYIKYPDWAYYRFIDPKTLEYLQYFVAGTLVRAHKDRFFSWLDRPWVLTWLVTIYTVCLVAHFHYGNQIREWSLWAYRLNYDVAGHYTGLLLVLYIFYHARASFDSNSRLMRGWRYIGRHTLVIYYLHYLLLPRMRWVGPYLSNGNTLLEQLIAGLAVSLPVIAICLAIGRLLERAPVLREMIGKVRN